MSINDNKFDEWWDEYSKHVRLEYQTSTYNIAIAAWDACNESIKKRKCEDCKKDGSECVHALALQNCAFWRELK